MSSTDKLSSLKNSHYMRFQVRRLLSNAGRCYFVRKVSISWVYKISGSLVTPR